MERGETRSASEALGTIRTTIPALADRDACPKCEVNPVEYHQPGGPGTFAVKGYCLKCQADVDADRAANDRNRETATAYKIEQAAAQANDPMTRKRMLRRFDMRIRAQECREANGGTCPSIWSRGEMCLHCDVTSNGKELYSNMSAAQAQPAKRSYQDSRRRA